MVSKDTAAEAASIDAAVEGKTLIEIFDRNASTYGDKAAIHWKEGDLWRHLTWKQYPRGRPRSCRRLDLSRGRASRLRRDHGRQPS